MSEHQLIATTVFQLGKRPAHALQDQCIEKAVGEHIRSYLNRVAHLAGTEVHASNVGGRIDSAEIRCSTVAA